MIRNKKELMNEGWNAMESLLNEEMPTKPKDHNYLLIGLLVFCAFGGGLWLGTSIDKQQANALTYNIGQADDAASDMHLIASTAIGDVITKNPIKNIVSTQIQKFLGTSPNKNQVQSTSIAETTVQKFTSVTYNNTTTTSIQNSNINNQEVQELNAAASSISRDELFDVEGVGNITTDELLSQSLAVSYLPRANQKVKKPTRWVLGLGMSSGVNPARDTKVASLKSEWMYKLGKQNAIGLEFIYAAEDKFGFLNFGDDSPEAVQTEREGKPSRETLEELIQNSRQFRYAAGLVLQQELGYRLYSNVGAGVNLIQNSYSNEIAFKSLNTIDNVKYHWGAYTSLTLGYRISRLIDLELIGTKSLLGQQDGQFQGGSTDQITGGLKISF